MALTAAQKADLNAANLNKLMFVLQEVNLGDLLAAAETIETAEIAAGALSADAAGRAIMAANYFDEATVDAKVAAGAIDADRLKGASIALGGAQMAADTLANLNSKISDATLVGVKKKTKTFTTADLTAAATSEAINLDTVFASAQSSIIGFYVDVTAEFSGGGAGSCTIQLGDSVDPNRHFEAENVFTGSGVTARKPTLGVGWSYPPDGGQAKLTFTADVNVDTLDAGSVQVDIFYFDHV